MTEQEANYLLTKAARIRARLDALMEAFNSEHSEEIADLETIEATLRTHVLDKSTSLKGDAGMVSYVASKTVTVWNSDALDGFAVSNPDLLRFRTEKFSPATTRIKYNKVTG